MTLRSFPNRLRLGGLAALVGGAIQLVAGVVRILNLAFPNLFEGGVGANIVAVFALGSWQSLAGVLLVGLGLIWLYVRQAEGAGIVGLVGFVLALVGNELVRANYLAVLFEDLGWALLGVGSLRARVYPRPAAVLLIVSAPVREIFNSTVRVALGVYVLG